MRKPKNSEETGEQEQIWKDILREASEDDGERLQRLNEALRSLDSSVEDRDSLSSAIDAECQRIRQSHKLKNHPIRFFLYNNKRKTVRAACVLIACFVVGATTAIAFPKITELFIQACNKIVEITNRDNGEWGNYYISEDSIVKTDYIPRGYHYNAEKSIATDEYASFVFIKDDSHRFSIKYYHQSSDIIIDPESQKTEERFINGSLAILEQKEESTQLTWAVAGNGTMTVECHNIPEETLLKIAEGIRVEEG